MLTVEEKTTIVGMAELRKVMKDVIEEIKAHKVILTKRNKPIGVLIDYEEFKKMEELVEAIEDFVLGQKALERTRRQDKKWVTLEEVEKKLGLR
jgi:prevent-host-death family protein